MAAMFNVLKAYCAWNENEVMVKKIPHAMSNDVFQVTHKDSKEVVLVRVYLDQDRAKSLDLDISRELGKLGLGPKILSECAEGSCEEWIDGRAMTLDEVLSEGYMTNLAKAIRALHDAGITHNDLHHNNIMIDAENCVRLIDFEYAKRDSTATDVLLDLANFFCEWMYNYEFEDWYIPRPLEDRFEALAMQFLTAYHHPKSPPSGFLEAILAHQKTIHVRWVQWGLDYFELTRDEKYLAYALARARLDSSVMEMFAKETRWQAHL